jgi:predicted permease
LFITDDDEGASRDFRGKLRRLGLLSWEVMKKIATNPLIIAVALGLASLGLRSLMPLGENGLPVFSLRGSLPFLYKALQQLAGVASPLALIALGGMFSFAAARGMLSEIIFGTLGRLVLAPVIGLGGAYLLGKVYPKLAFTPGVYPALVALFGSPVATTSAIMAKEMHNDEQLASQLVVWTSVLSIFTIYITVILLRSAHLL